MHLLNSLSKRRVVDDSASPNPDFATNQGTVPNAPLIIQLPMAENKSRKVYAVVLLNTSGIFLISLFYPRG